MLNSLPILDLSQLDAGPEAAAFFRDALRRATHEVGFFYLTGTGIPRELEKRMLSTSRAFFALPEADKLTIENAHSPHFRGYTRLGGERTLGAVDWREQIDICPEGVALSSSELEGKPAYARLVGPNQWPAALPALRPVVEEWTTLLTEVAQKLLRTWAEALGEAPDFFDQTFGEPFTLLKVIRYPESQSTEQGVGSHKDAGVLTLLWIEEGKTGLQVEHDGGWIDAPPVPGALVVNIGEMLEYATQGYLKATTHRVLAPKNSDRVSIPFFFNPALDARLPLVRMPPGLVAPGVSQDPRNPIHALYGENCLKSRLRAHPNVAEAHYADIVVA
ncbi:isopenicillin N synthase [Cutaneotrichosporon oleaginosum]|uniref:Isopenicillin N synthase n=1 Tax=Cutaneotrichosporon oleaginosum TaxID=879819 RepID=A0A0J0XSA9_9TREE|nr:isopenicillin N synthase [Cutaneotrichosporon oleaginosum]KLT43963.1 isopenicillin N synthase [Cutaneotrichosporon oleaginosum]TXT04090.1 hypothetical protein COLE_07787 [Cutaneotrichosporon oleaginosum]